MSSKPLTDAISDGRLLIVRLSMLGPFPTRLETWQVDPDMLHNVARLARVIPVVISTSRPVAEARERLGLDGVHIVGLSGGEFWAAHALLPDIDAGIDASVSDIKALIDQHMAKLVEAGAQVERHGVLHFRDSSGREDPRAREAVEEVTEEAKRLGLHVSEDEVAFTHKIRPAETGVLARRVLDMLNPDRVTCFGFDEADVVTFQVLKSELEGGKLRRLCTVGALYEGHSTPIKGHAHEYVSDLEGVADLLARLATALTPRDYRGA